MKNSILKSSNNLNEQRDLSQKFSLPHLISSAEFRLECLRLFGKFAHNPDMDFRWYDAAINSLRLRELVAREQPFSRRDENIIAGSVCEGCTISQNALQKLLESASCEEQYVSELQ